MRKENALAWIDGSARTSRQHTTVAKLAEDVLNSLTEGEDGIPPTIISGGSDRDRNAALWEILRRSTAKGVPTIIIHAGNTALQSALMKGPNNVFLPKENKYGEVELFKDISPEYIARILSDAANDAKIIEADVAKAIEFGAELLEATGNTCSLQNLIEFPWREVPLYIQMHADDIDAVKAMDTASNRLSELRSVETVVARLRQEMPRSDLDTDTPVSIMDVIHGGGCYCVDIGSADNKFTLSILLAILREVSRARFPFLTVVDSLPIPQAGMLADLLCRRNRRNPTVYLSHDVPAMLGMSEELFHSLVSGMVNLILFSHEGFSADRWSAYFSQHYVIREEYSASSARENIALISRTDTTGIVRRKEREAVIPSEEFKLPAGVALVYPAGRNLIMPIAFRRR